VTDDVRVLDLWLWSGEVERLLADQHAESQSLCRHRDSHASWDLDWHQRSSNRQVRSLQFCCSTVWTVATVQDR